jgi:hypothetical protein
MSSVSGLSYLDIANNYMDVSGCSSYSEVSSANTLSTVTVGSIVNKGWVATTGVFKF